MLFVLSACGDPGPDAATQAALLGVWQDVSMDQTLQFMEDGQGVVDVLDVRYKWVSASEIEIDYSPKAARANVVRYLVDLEGDTLRLTWQEGDASYTQTFIRVE
jgi:hypothetical protein